MPLSESCPEVPIKTAAEHYQELLLPLADLKSCLDEAVRQNVVRFLELVSYSLDRTNDLPDFESATSEEESRERFLRIAASTLLSDPGSTDTAQDQRTSVEDLYNQFLIEPLRSYFAELERSTEALSENEALALVDYAGERGFKDPARAALSTAERRPLVTLHLLLTRILGYERESEDLMDPDGQEPP